MLSTGSRQMIDDFVKWLPWAEVIFAGPACVICAFLFIILIFIPLPSGCKCFVYLNTAALLSIAVCQVLIAEWTSHNNRQIGPTELFYFPLIFAHQFVYFMSTASLFYLTCERLYLCYHPTFYEKHKLKLVPCLIGAVFLETLLVIPLTVMLQYEGTQHIATLIVSLLDLTTLTLLLTCYRQSQHYYRTQFAKVNLNVRYQVKEVMELTRVLIPIGCVSLLLKLTVELLALFVFTNAAYIGTSVLVLRFVATTMSYAEPILLIVRHRSISRKVVALITLGRVHPAVEPMSISTEDVTRSYFTALRRD
ncbi:hypothetical protein PRIPAC_79457 [Pristionchus pacificus]|uniref:Uncharacterized protein n=1 Tax=Pristionchus pacificus TaxID=54126 RepID=A0A2A6CQG5_PRIPA|nr:hypothetical protein PRIPAC_79457 [Pristionchus pacificus]|eukprot:PDM80283.1 hypothetical protein PRIPAC_32862 [Pristionchus pacificus]